jgi:hypothetical protein
MVNGPSHDSAHHEASDIDLRGVLRFGLGLLVVGIVIHLAVWLLFLYFADRATSSTGPQYPLAKGQENRLPPEPRLQTNPRQDLRDLRASEDAILNSYGWVDKNTGTMRIPIDEAMKLAVERGLPARTESK